MFCPKCGNKLDEDSRFCDKCGTQINRNRGGGQLPKQQEKKNSGKSLGIGVIAVTVVCCVVICGVVIAGKAGKLADSKEILVSQTEEIYETEDSSYVVADNEADESETGNFGGVNQAEVMEKFCSLSRGDEVSFGIFEQDNDYGDREEEIVWIVLSVEEDRILLLSKYVLDYQKITNYQYKYVTWAVTPVRTWLNENFYYSAFTENERSVILNSSIHTPDTVGHWGGRSDQEYITKGGMDTFDYIFLLSTEEVEMYVEELNVLLARPTEYCIAQGGYLYESTGYTDWIFRSVAGPIHWEDDFSVTTKDNSAEFMGCLGDGRIRQYGFKESGIRPAMWVQIK